MVKEYQIAGKQAYTVLSVCSFPRRLESLRRKERSEAHLYLTVEVYLEDDFQGHTGPDLVDFDDIRPRWAALTTL